MLVLVVLTTGVVTVLTYALLPGRKRERTTGAPVPGRTVSPPPRAESTEGLLVAQLFRGDLTRVQYLRAMECLAARDEARNPVPLPD